MNDKPHPGNPGNLQLQRFKSAHIQHTKRADGLIHNFRKGVIACHRYSNRD